VFHLLLDLENRRKVGQAASSSTRMLDDRQPHHAPLGRLVRMLFHGPSHCKTPVLLWEKARKKHAVPTERIMRPWLIIRTSETKEPS
jgi:hypothetical protein